MGELCERCVIGLVAAALLTASTAVGEEAGQLYLGVGLGRLDYRSDYAGVGYGDTPIAARLYGGFQLRERAAIELAFATADLEPGELLGSGIERLEISADYRVVVVRGTFTLALRELWPRWQRLTVFGTAGAFAADEERQVTELVSGRTRDQVVDDGGIAYGAGVSFELPRLRIRAGFERLDGRDADQAGFDVGAELRF